MAVIFIVLFIALVIALARKESPPLVYDTLSRAAQRLYTTIYGGGVEDRPRISTDRETTLWVQSQPIKKLKQVRCYLSSEISNLQPTDWDAYMFDAILSRSTKLFFFLDKNGNVTVYAARGKEREGIQDALKAVQYTDFEYPFTLRTLFHDIFHSIILYTRMDDRYYSYGQLKVINLLRSYQASIGSCLWQPDADAAGEKAQISAIARLAMYFRWLEEQRELNMVDINRGFPIIEFDLQRIDRMDIFKHEGSLLNSLFLYIITTIARITGAEPFYTSFSELTYDMKAACFTHGDSEVYVVKHTGISEDFAHRLYVEFANLTPRDPLYCEIYSMKLHFERNN